jgi:hypothetical protein
MFGPKREEVAGRLHREEFHNLYVSPIIIRMIKSMRVRWAGHVARMGEVRNAYNIFIVKTEGQRQLGSHGRICVDNIRMDLVK